LGDPENSLGAGTKPVQMEKLVDRVTAQFRAPVVGVARHFINAL
jgi:hypothetical protein